MSFKAMYVMVDPVDLLTGEKNADIDKYAADGPWMPVEKPPARAREGATDSKIVMLRMDVGGETIEMPGWYNHEEQIWYVWKLHKGGKIIGWAEARL